MSAVAVFLFLLTNSLLCNGVELRLFHIQSTGYDSSQSKAAIMKTISENSMQISDHSLAVSYFEDQQVRVILQLPGSIVSILTV